MRVKSKHNWENADTACEGNWPSTREAAEPSALEESGCYHKVAVNFRGNQTFSYSTYVACTSRSCESVYDTKSWGCWGWWIDLEFCNMKLIRENLSIWQWQLISWQGPLETVIACSWSLGKIKGQIKWSKYCRIFTADGSGRDQMTFVEKIYYIKARNTTPRYFPQESPENITLIKSIRSLLVRVVSHWESQ